MTNTISKQPKKDPAEENAYFPSDYSLSQFTRPVSDLSDAEYPQPHTSGKKILVIASDERYLPTDNGSLFSTGNHPVETLVPMYHLHAAGFDFDIATLSGRMAKFEYWAMPHEDKKIMPFFKKYQSAFRSPEKLSNILSSLDSSHDYAAVFIPGGHGALIGLPESEEVAEILRWFIANDRFVISICHGPAAFLALRNGDNPLNGYSLCAFPDAADKQTPELGYMPGHLTWYFGEQLSSMGMKIMNTEIKGSVFQDRKLLTGDSPFAANALGKLAAEQLLLALNH